MQKNLLLGLVAVILLAIPVCHALDDSGDKIIIKAEPVRNKVLPGEWASFNVSITNRQMVDDTFVITVKGGGVEWSVLTASTVDYSSGIKIKSGDTRTTQLLLKDKGLLPNPLKPYSVQLGVKSLRKGNKATELLLVYLVSEIPVDYESDINVSPRIPRYIDPRNTYSFKVALYNNNQKDIKDLKMSLESSLVNREASVELEPSSRKVVDFTVDFDEETPPTIDTLTITVSEKGKKLYRSTFPMEVVGYRMPFEKSNKTEEGFLKRTTKITLTNDDNVEQQQTFMAGKSLLDSIFTSAEPGARIVQRKGDDYYAWDINLKPDESAVITLTTNYRLLFYILVIIIIAGVVYIYTRDPVAVIKNCDSLGGREGGINDLKVIISIKNRTNEKIKDVRLIDLIPKIAQVEKKDGEGTLKPSRKVNTNKGLALEWNFDMDAKEERLVYYYIKSRLSILGGLKLPKAAVIIKRKGKKQQKVRSNDVHIAGK